MRRRDVGDVREACQPGKLRTRRVGANAFSPEGTNAASMRQEAVALAGLAAAAVILHLGRKKKSQQQPEGAATGVIFTGTGAVETLVAS